MDALRVLGADVRPVPAVPFDNPDNYNHQACKGKGEEEGGRKKGREEGGRGRREGERNGRGGRKGRGRKGEGKGRSLNSAS